MLRSSIFISLLTVSPLFLACAPERPHASPPLTKVEATHAESPAGGVEDEPIPVITLPMETIHGNRLARRSRAASVASPERNLDGDLTTAAALAVKEGPGDEVPAVPAFALSPRPMETAGDGALQPDVVQRRIAAKSVEARACLAHDDAASPTAWIDLVIEHDGAVSHVGVLDGAAHNPDAMICLTHVFKGLTFPHPSSQFVDATFPVRGG